MQENEIKTAWRTSKGRRSVNEDAYLVLTAKDLQGVADGLFVVADGMGGRSSGAHASHSAVDVIRDVFISEARGARGDLQTALRNAMRMANAIVYKEANASPELHGMGTTCAAVAVSSGKAFLAHLGDSRVYLFRDGRLRRLTEDHSIVAEKVRTGDITEEEARRSRFRNVITRAVGIEANAEPDLGVVDLIPGDNILLCTDGLIETLSDEELAGIILDSKDLKEACEQMVQTALDKGGRDNITVIMVQLPGRVGQKTRSTEAMKWRIPFLVSVLLGLILGFVAGVLLGRVPVLNFVGSEPRRTTPVLGESEGVKYEEPVSLSHMVFQEQTLAPAPFGGVYAVDLQGRLNRIDKWGAISRIGGRFATLKATKNGLGVMFTTDAKGNIYISDPGHNEIVRLDKNGSFKEGIASGKLVRPGALTIDKDGNIFVIDAGRLKVIRVKPESKDGN